MEKGEIDCIKQFPLFPQCFLPIWRTFFHFCQILNCRWQTLSVLKSLKFVVWEGLKQVYMEERVKLKMQLWCHPYLLCVCHFNLGSNKLRTGLGRVENIRKGENVGYYVCSSFSNPFPNKPWFLRVCSTSLLKILWEKEKLLITSNFYFTHSVFYLLEELYAIFIKVEIVIYKLLQEQFLLFPLCFLPIWRTFCHFHLFWNCRLQNLWVWKSLKFFVWERAILRLLGLCGEWLV